MNLLEYQEKANYFAVYPDRDKIRDGSIIGLAYVTLGLCGESGEFSEKIKKVIRDHNNEIDEAKRELLLYELGDIMWYVSQAAFELCSDLEEVAELNIKKLRSRADRNVIKGEGDSR